MSKKRSKEKRRIPAAVEAAGQARNTKGSAARPDPAESGNPISEFFASKGVRETIESIAIAFILAFLFRTFEAEAFVIPTGSMAETLRGRHKDLRCAECGYLHMAGASEGNVQRLGDVVGSTCPMCRHINRFEPNSEDVPYYTGDRILVSKFVYDLEEPERWDVVVFKFPFNAKQNYIKRLVGKPGETLKISGGDLWVKPLDSGEEFSIARKPPEKITAMMQTVHDTRYVPQELAAAGWPSRWQPTSADNGWEIADEVITEDGYELVNKTFRTEGGSAEQAAWLRYHHYTATQADWDAVAAGEVDPPPQKLVTDFYAYNAFIHGRRQWQVAGYESPEALGLHWVGDLAMEAEVEIESNEGTLLLDLVEAGRHYRCAVNVADGKATLSIVDIDGNAGQFSDDAGENAAATVSGQTKVGPGAHRLRFANVDNQLTLWVNGTPVKFDGPTTFLTEDQLTPRWNEQDDGDLAPAGIGSRGAQLAVKRLQMFRDVYYIAVKSPNQFTPNTLMDYEPRQPPVRSLVDVIREARAVLDAPRAARQRIPAVFNSIFNGRRRVEFDLEKHPTDSSEDQFFTLGDNSPQSQDARIWNNKRHHVERKYLLGKALFIYWPHATGPLYLPNPWDRFSLTLPITPNFSRMKFVR